MLVQVFHGSETFQGHGSARIMAWHRETPGAPDIPLETACKDPHSGVTMRNTESLPAGPVPYYGMWKHQTVNIQKGLLKLSVMVYGRAGSPMMTHHIFLQPREHAALRKIGIPLTQAPNANQSVGYWQGNFDIIPEIWYRSMGIVVPDEFLHEYEDEGRSALRIRFVEDEPETTPYYPPEVLKVLQRGEATQTVVRSSPRRRMVILKKPK